MATRLRVFLFGFFLLSTSLKIVDAHGTEETLAKVAYQLPELSHMDPPSQRAERILRQMAFHEKIQMIQGTGWFTPYSGRVPGIDRLNVPSLNLNDGPQGFRDPYYPGTSTLWPSGLTAAASFDPELIAELGVAMGEEFLGKGANVHLGPGVNIARVPLNGRGFEYLSGEDPHLGVQLVTAYIKAVQSTGVIANVKHFINNNQEDSRYNQSSNVDERTEMEIYMPVFRAAVNAGVLSAMCGYNRVNGVFSCLDKTLLTDILKENMTFGGFVVSDWLAARSTEDAALSGLDLLMPGGPGSEEFAAPLVKAIEEGKVPISAIDEKVKRILTSMFAAGIFDRNSSSDTSKNVTSLAHNTLARKIAAQSAVLLKNNGALPIAKTTVGKIAVIGEAGFARLFTGASDGSGAVSPYYQASPLEGISIALNGNFPRPEPRSPTCTITAGHDVFSHTKTFAPASTPQECCQQCSLVAWCNAFAFNSSDHACNLMPSFFAAFPLENQTYGVCTGTTSPPPLPTNLVYSDGSNIEEASQVAADSNLVIVVIATLASEMQDRANLSFSDHDDALVAAVASRNPNTVVVTINPGAVLMPWSEKVNAILAMFYPGQEEGNALADVLFGLVEPGGRLPITFPNVENEMKFTKEQYPGVLDNSSTLLSGTCGTFECPVSGSESHLYSSSKKRKLHTRNRIVHLTADEEEPESAIKDQPPPIQPSIPPTPPLNTAYSEKLNVGYRWYHSHGVVPKFPFGHGLSYTSFAYSNLRTGHLSYNLNNERMAHISVTFNVRNSGPRDGFDVPQLYLTFPEAAGEPPRQLRGFKKIFLKSQEEQWITFTLTNEDFSIWDSSAHAFAVFEGVFTVEVGASSQDIREVVRVSV